MKQIIINSEELQTRVAVVDNGILHDFFMERNDRDQLLVGSIYKAKIKNLEPSLQAAFVDIGCGKNAFLHYWDMIPATQESLEADQFEWNPEEESDDDNAAEQKRPVVEKKTAPKGRGFFARLCRFLTGQTEDEPEEEQPIVTGKARKAQQHNRQQKNRPPRGGQKGKKPIPTVADIPNIFHVDQEILVQVTKGPIGTKGARVTTNLSIPGRYLVLLPSSTHNGISRRVEEKSERDRLRKMMRELHLPNNMGVICRTVGAGRKLEHFQRDLDLLMEYWGKSLNGAKKSAPLCVYQEPPLAERALRDCLTEDIDEIVTDSEAVYQRAMELIKRYNMQGSVRVKLYDHPTPIFQRFGLTPQLETIFCRKVMLPSGGYLCIDETEALIAIDVNTGKNRTGKDQPETILATNLEAVKEIARQLRLRNVGGLVVLDLIDMKQKKDQMLVYKTLKDLMEEDHARTKVYPISPLGLLEMTRQREHESLESAIFDNCPYCKGRGLIKSPTTMSVEIQRRLNEVVARKKVKKIIVKAHPRVLERLRNEDKKLYSDIEAQAKISIVFEQDPMLHVEEYQLLDASTMQKI